MAYKYILTKDSIFGESIFTDEALDDAEFLILIIKTFKEINCSNPEAIINHLLNNDKRFYKLNDLNSIKKEYNEKVIIIDDNDIISFITVEYENSIPLGVDRQCC